MSGDDDRGPSVTRRSDAAADEAGPLRRFWEAESGPTVVVREALVSAAIVVAVGLLLFGVSGVWPPMVAVESPSMEPHMYRGDLIVISEPGRYVPAASAQGTTGVVTAEVGAEADYRTFGGNGSVVVYRPDGRGGTPVIHRAELWVSEGENWYDRADPDFHRAESCADLPNCPAPHAGFVTKGDNNAAYDQVIGISDPVRPSWLVGVAHVRVPWLGHVRLWLAANGATAPADGGVTPGGSSVGPTATNATG